MASKLVEFIAAHREAKRTTANVIQLISKVGKHDCSYEDIQLLKDVNKSLKAVERMLVEE